MGMTERTMLKRATSRLITKLGLNRDKCKMIRELPIGSTIADLVIIYHPSAHHWPAAPLSVAESAVLASIRHRGGSHTSRIGKDIAMSAATVRRLVDGRLSSLGLVRKSNDDFVTGRGTWAKRSKVIAIEAKLTRWRKALAQAQTYQRYANQSYVLLPRQVAEVAVENRQTFEDAGVGLLSFDSKGVHCHISSSDVRSHAWQREYALSRARPISGRSGVCYGQRVSRQSAGRASEGNRRRQDNSGRGSRERLHRAAERN